MIAKAFLKNSGRKLARYFTEEKKGERVRVLEVRGFASEDIHEAFQSADVMALATQSSKHLMHLSVRNRAGENLTDEQWLYVADRLEKRLGLSGQPRGIVFHINKATGEHHMHIGWSRIDDMTMTVRPVPFFFLRLKEVCRELEWELGLEVLSNARKGKSRCAEHWEDQQAHRLGVDLKALRAKICECWERPDSGKSFRAALAEEGMELLKGDRRSYLVMDEKGGLHALGKRLLGITADKVRERLADLDYQALPTVAQAREQMRTGMRDQHAADLAWQDAVAAAAIAKEKTEGRFKAEPRFSMDQYEKLAPLVLDQVSHCNSTFTRFDIMRALKNEIENKLDREGLARAILEHPDVVPLKAKNGKVLRYTTQAVIDSERHVLHLAEALNQHDWHDVSPQSVEAKSKALSAEQGKALAFITERSGLAILHGQAGTGKTAVLAAGREVYEANGCRVIGLAHQNQMVQELKQRGFTHANTIDSELWGLSHGRKQWSGRSVIMLDEGAMVDTRRLGMVLAHAEAAGAKVVVAGDHKQQPAIERSGLFEVLIRDFGAAVLTEVHRQKVPDEREASQLMAAGKFAPALKIYADKGAIHWSEKQTDAMDALLKKYLEDSAARPDKTRFIFAYRNDAVNQLNAAARQARIGRGELQDSRSFETKHGPGDFAVGDRVQFSCTDKLRGIYNGHTGTLRRIDGMCLTVEIDGQGSAVQFDARHFQGFRHGYASTVYKAQGRTFDETYALHSTHLRSTSSYVILTRHSAKTELFVSREMAPDMSKLRYQMSRPDERRAASYFLPALARGQDKPLTPAQLAAWYANQDNRARQFGGREKTDAHDRTRSSLRSSDIRIDPAARSTQASHSIKRGFGVAANSFDLGAGKATTVARGALSGVSRILGPLSALLGGARPAPMSDAEPKKRSYLQQMQTQAHELDERMVEKERERKRRDDRQR